MSDARITIWDADTAEDYVSFPMNLRPIVNDDETVQIALEVGRANDLLILPEWAGRKMSIQVSPKALTGEPMTQAILALAKEMGASVG